MPSAVQLLVAAALLHCVAAHGATRVEVLADGDTVLTYEDKAGDWGEWDACTGYRVASGMRTKSEEKTEDDNTALNAVQMYCRAPAGAGKGEIGPVSFEGSYGWWDAAEHCPDGYDLAGFKVLHVPCCDVLADDTSANQVVFFCRNSAGQVTKSNPLGKSTFDGAVWTEDLMCPAGSAVTAIRSKVEWPLLVGDNTALNGVSLRCTPLTDACKGCLNGGTCDAAAATCKCDSAFKGAHCETRADQWSSRLYFNESGFFKIAQFTDMHYNLDLIKQEKTEKAQKLFIAEEEPDFVVVTGDCTTGAQNLVHSLELPLWHKALKVLDESGLRWTMAFGNHDYDGTLKNEELIRLMRSKRGSLIEYGPDEAYGSANFYLPIWRTKEPVQGEVPAAVLWVMPVQPSNCRNVAGDGCVTDSQVAWFTAASQQLVKQYGLAQPPFSLMFYHVPVPEYVDVWNTQPCRGNKSEHVCCPKVNTGLYAAAYSAGVRGMFVGHDHKNDFCGAFADKPALQLCYGRKSGYGAYGPDTEHGQYVGSRIIEMQLGKGQDVSWTTWIHDDKSQVVYQQVHVPEGSDQSSC